MDELIRLDLIAARHTASIFRLVDSNRQHLRQWLPFVDSTVSENDTKQFVDFALSQYAQKAGAHYLINYQGHYCGICGYAKITHESRVGEIGYWVAKDYEGKGIVTAAARELIKIGFRDFGLNKIEIHCASENVRSASVAQRLNMMHEATLRAREFINGRHHNVDLYSLLRSEYGEGIEEI